MEIAQYTAFQYILSHMDDAVCVTDKTGVLKYANAAAERLLGISLAGGEQKKIWQVIPFVERNDRLIQLFLDAVRPPYASQQALTDYENNRGEVYKFRVCLTYTRDDDGTFIVVINDLTELFKVSAAFSRYTSRQIAEYVLSTPEGARRGGQARDITVLMSDLRGSTALSEALEPEDLITVLNHYFEAMITVIEACEGNVIEFLGDGLFVVFGAPADDEHHADHAVTCAVRMQKAMEQVNAWNRENGYPELSMGIGLHSGRAVVGNIGSSDKMKYGCIGETVNLAGRTESCTVGGQVLATQATVDRLTDKPRILSSMTITPKGITQAVTLHHITGYGEDNLEGEKAPVYNALASALTASWQALKGKSVSDKALKGHLTALDRNGRFALFNTDEPLSVFDNILLDIGGGTYAKITGRTEKGWVLCFTAKGTGFDRWINSLRFKDNT